MPERYVTQVLSEMATLDVKKVLYGSYSPQSTSVFEVSWDQNLWEDILAEVTAVYLADCPHHPTTFSATAKSLKPKVTRFVKENVKMVAEVLCILR